MNPVALLPLSICQAVAAVSTLWEYAYLVDIAITVAEWFGLALYHRLTGRGLPAEA